jgi:putative transposase
VGKGAACSFDFVNDDDDARLEWALFRYRLIAEAVEAEKSARGALLKAVAAEEHFAPGGTLMKFSLRTLERWVARYDARKLTGLKRKARGDKGKTRSLTAAALERVTQLRKEEPSRSTPTLIDIAEREGTVGVGALKRSTVDRHLDKGGASRRLMQVLGTKRHVRLAFAHPMDFVVGDFHAGPYVRTETGEIRRTELEAFVDHASRFLPESRYGLTEDMMAVRKAMRGLCTAWGLPRRIYVDNGPSFQARRFHFACSELGIELVHSRPYVSEGRGLVERFNRTVKESFEVEVRLRREPPTLAELNAFWWAWLDERYHRRPHSETGEAPFERWQRLLPEAKVKAVDPVMLDEVLRLHARRRVHAKTSTVEIGGVPFVVDTSLRRRRVDVLYDASDLSSVVIYFDGRRIQRAVPQVKGETPVDGPVQTPKPAPTVDYLALLQKSHERRRAEALSTIRFRAVPDVSAQLTLSRLLEQLHTCSGRALGEVERQHAAEVLHGLAPLEIAIADAAFKVAVTTLGHGLHAAQYLAALREAVLHARRKANP